MGFWNLLSRREFKPKQVAKKIGRLMENAKTESIYKIYVPSRFRVILSKRELSSFEPFKSKVLKELTDYINHYADEKGYHLRSTPEIRFEFQDDVKLGRFRVEPILVDDTPMREFKDQDVSDTTMVFEKPEFSITSEHNTTIVYSTLANSNKNPLPRLEIIDGPDEGLNFELKGPIVSIGRREDNQIMLNDTNVSRYHARIINEHNWRIDDLNSTNGMFVNGKQVKTCQLQSDDEIKLGSTLMKFYLR